MVLAETHLPNKNNFQIASGGHGGNAILIRNRLTHHFLESHERPYMQAASVCLKNVKNNLVIFAIYCPPRFSIT